MLVILPYKKTTNCELHLIMDLFSGHKAEEITSLLAKNKIVHHYIPSGCTGLLQPLDVGCNKVFKDKMRRKYYDYLDNEFDSKRILNEIDPPSEEDLIHWISTTLEEFEKTMVIDSFKRCGIDINPDESHKVSPKLLNYKEIFDHFSEMDKEKFAKLEGIEDIFNEDEIEDMEVMFGELSNINNDEEDEHEVEFSSEEDEISDATTIPKKQIQFSLEKFGFSRK
jgi:hypothetical protein